MQPQLSPARQIESTRRREGASSPRAELPTRIASFCLVCNIVKVTNTITNTSTDTITNTVTSANTFENVNVIAAACA